MCVCFFFWIHVLKIAVERWFWEVNMMFGSLVELHAWLHSCLCFSLLEKLLLKASSTPPRHLAIYRALKLFSYRNLDTSSIAGGSIEKVLGPSIAGGSIKLLFLCLCFVPRHLLDSCIYRRCFFSTPLDTSICRELLRIYIYALRDPVLISSISLDLSALVHPKHSLLHI